MCFSLEKSQIQTYFDSQSHPSHNENKGFETSVPQFSGIFPGFSEIFPGFSTNQNFWSAALPLSTPLGENNRTDIFRQPI